MVNRLALLFVLLFLPFVMKAQEKREAIYHTVQKGEIWYRIASIYQTKVDSLVKWNHMTDPNRINVGQKIIVGWQEMVTTESDSIKSLQPTNPKDVSDSIFIIGENPVMPPIPPDPPTNSQRGWHGFLLGTLFGLALGISLYKLLIEK